MADFAGSSQVSSWLFTAPALGKYLEMPAPCHMQRILNDAEEHRVAANSGNTDEALALSASQRAMLLRHFEQSLLRCTAALRFDETLQASAVTLFKRFYVHNAFVKGAPFQIAPAALALGIKTEACPYNEVPSFLEAAAKTLNTDTGGIMQNEMAFMVGIKFHLTLHHPYKALRGLMADFKLQHNVQLASTADAALQPVGATPAAAPAPMTVPMGEWRTLASRARLFVMHSLIALAALQLAAQSHSDLHAPLHEPPPASLSSSVLQYVSSLMAAAGTAASTTAAPVAVTPTPQAVPAAAGAILAAAAAPDVSASALPLLAQVAPAAEADGVFGSAAFLAKLQAPPRTVMPSGPQVPAYSAAAPPGPTAAAAMGDSQGAAKKRRT